MQDNECIFCKIAREEIPAEILYQDELVIAFRDIHPVTPVHVLIIPRAHIVSVNHADASDEAILGHLFTVARHLAAENEIDQSGYRLVVNTGPDAGQSVFHLHMHLIGGRRMPFRFE
jgi:histidine triad (HIT) family protein